MSDSKFLIIGDLHVQVSNLTDSVKLFDFIIHQASKNNIKNLIFLGDIFHTHAVIRQEVAIVVKNFFENLKALGYVSYIIVGNHDSVSPRDTQTNAVSLLLADLAIVVKSLSGYYISNGNNVILHFLPYIHSSQEFANAANNLFEQANTLEKKFNILFCHQPFAGVRYENGAPSYESDLLAETIKHDLIISGHIHKKQFFNKLFYVGTPRPITWGEVDQEKGIYILDVNYPHDLQFVSTAGIVPHFYSCTITKDDIPNSREILENMANAVKFVKDMDKLCITIQSNDASLVKQIKELANEIFGSFVLIRQESFFESSTNESLNVEKFSWTENIKTYIQSSSLIDENIKKEVIDVCLKIWGEVHDHTV